jgi:hypothetical protein
MRTRLVKAAILMLSVLALGACGQIGNPRATPSPGGGSTAGSLPPPIPSASTGGNVVDVPPGDSCAVVKELQGVADEVDRWMASLNDLQSEENANAVLAEARSGLGQARQHLGQIPPTSDAEVTKVGQLMGQAIAGYITGLEHLEEGYATTDEALLLQAAVELEQAQTTFDQQVSPALSKSRC